MNSSSQAGLDERRACMEAIAGSDRSRNEKSMADDSVGGADDLQTWQRRLQHMLHDSDQPLVVTDLEGHVTGCSRGTMQLLEQLSRTDHPSGLSVRVLEAVRRAAKEKLNGEQAGACAEEQVNGVHLTVTCWPVRDSENRVVARLICWQAGNDHVQV